MSPAFTVNLSTAGSQTDPDVVALRDGGFVVVWDNAQLGNLQGRRFDALGNPVGGEFVAGDAEGESDPAVAALADGRFVVAYRNFAGDTDILATVFDPYGPRNSDFNKDVVGVRPGSFVLCATVKSVTGCLSADVVN